MRTLIKQVQSPYRPLAAIGGILIVAAFAWVVGFVWGAVATVNVRDDETRHSPLALSPPPPVNTELQLGATPGDLNVALQTDPGDVMLAPPPSKEEARILFGSGEPAVRTCGPEPIGSHECDDPKNWRCEGPGCPKNEHRAFLVTSSGAQSIVGPFVSPGAP